MVTEDMIQVAENIITDITDSVSKLQRFDLPDVNYMIRSTLHSEGVLSKYSDNPLVIQELMMLAQRRLLKDPVHSYNIINAIPYEFIIHDPYIDQLIRDPNTPLESWLGAYNDNPTELVKEALFNLSEYAEYDVIMNRVFCGISHEIFTPTAIWLALKGGSIEDSDGLSAEYGTDLGIQILANRGDYFYYPGAEEELMMIVDAGLTKAIEMITTKLENITDLRNLMMYSLYSDVASVFSIYGDRSNTLGIDQVTVDLAERIVYRVTDAVITSVWDNVDYLVENKNTNSSISTLLDRIVRLYLELSILI